MKLCPKCELNYIYDYEELCSVCKTSEKNLNGGNQAHKPRANVSFDEDFVFSNIMEKYRGKLGYKAYNANGENIGIVFMSDDKRSPAYGYCELCIFENYQNRYGEWHRFTSHGFRLEWEALCEKLKTQASYKCYID